MSTVVSHKGSHRSVTELPEANWIKHKDVIIAWCDGADVEIHREITGWCPYLVGANVKSSSLFSVHDQHRIAQRKPQPGEVWDISGRPYVFHRSADDYPLVSLDGDHAMSVDGGNLTYVAPSIEAYYARRFQRLPSHAKWLDDNDEVNAYVALSVINAAKLGEVK